MVANHIWLHNIDYSRPRNVGTLDKTDSSVGEGLVGAPAVRIPRILPIGNIRLISNVFSAATLCDSISRSTPRHK